MVLLALGVSTGFIGSTIAGVEGVDDDYAGVASAVVNASSQIGSAIGLATIGASFLTSDVGRHDEEPSHLLEPESLDAEPTEA